MLSSALVISTILFFHGCDNSFDPKQEYKEKLVVFGVLDKSSEYQMIRLESTYDAEGTNPYFPKEKKEITEAKVMIISETRVYHLKDTLIEMGNGTQKKIWITREFKPDEGKTYRLKVEATGFDVVTAETKVPSKSYLQMFPPGIEGKGGVQLSAGAISTVATPKGFYFRLWITGKKNVNSDTVEVRREVPIRYDSDTGEPIFTKPGRESVVIFPTEIITDVRSKIDNIDQAKNVQIVGTGYTMDAYIYNYFYTVRGFDDPVSVRQDRPDVTNIVGGLGVFGSIVADSIRNNYHSIIISK